MTAVLLSMFLMTGCDRESSGETEIGAQVTDVKSVGSETPKVIAIVRPSTNL